ncbi:hypothetical protein N7504_004976, partial [Penicillium tannophilum]
FLPLLRALDPTKGKPLFSIKEWPIVNGWTSGYRLIIGERRLISRARYALSLLIIPSTDIIRH